MNSPETHLAEAGATQRSCKECGGLFTPRRAWADFCKNKCRNDFHGRERRKEAIRARSMEMYEALRKIADGLADPWAAAALAQAAIKDLKAP